MGEYADRIVNLELVKILGKSAGRDDIAATDIAKLVAIVNDVADIAGPLLELVPQTFKQYTNHNVSHCRNLIYLMGKFIPKKTLKELNGLELAVLILSALLHDFGMFVSEQEKADALKSDKYKSFLASHHDRALAVEEARRNNDYALAELIEDALLAEYFRRLHPERARDYFNKCEQLKGRLVFREEDISPYVLDVCESHAWGVRESNDPLRPEKAVSELSTNRAVYNVPLNLQYIACCLRLADIMDFDRSRTPLVVFQNIRFTEQKSWEEWNKHLQVKGWKINEKDVIFRTECTHPSFYVAVMEFLDWVDVELRDCRQLIVKEAPQEIAERYLLHLPPVVDRSEVEMKDKRYLAGAFRFYLEYERIIKLLMDKSLYPDPSLFLRELLQNSLDACRNREAHAKEKRAKNLYEPRIAVWDYSDDPEQPRIVFQDNGIGMSRKIVEEYFMRVGRSYYRSPEFDAERQRLKAKGIELEATSQFGIGILSCFIVADRFEVETYRIGHKPLHITIEGPTKYFIIEILEEPARTDFPTKATSDIEDGPPQRPGTRITVYLRPNLNVSVLQVLGQLAVNTDYDIKIYTHGSTKPKKIRRRRWDSTSIQLSKFPQVTATQRGFSSDQWALSEEDESQPFVNKALEGILVPSVINFQDYDFSRHLCGKAWLWLLRGADNEPCPQRGFLRVTREWLDLVGLPRFMCNVLRELVYFNPDLEELVESLRGQANRKGALDKKSDAYGLLIDIQLDYVDISKYEAKSIADQFINSWSKFSAQEKQAVCNSMEAIKFSGPTWFESSDAAKSLLLGNYDWSEQPLGLQSHSAHLNALPQSFALHGISLPGGLMKWNPMNGYARKLKLLAVPGGVQLDARGSLAPTPAASRLFVDLEEAGKTAIPFARAALRHVLQLVAGHPDEPTWKEWLIGFIETTMPLYFWPEAVKLELELLEAQLMYCLGGYLDKEYMSHQQLIRRYDQWVPVNTHKQFGLNLNDDVTAILVSCRPRRKRGGIWEVDIVNKTAVQGETLQQIKRDVLQKLMADTT